MAWSTTHVEKQTMLQIIVFMRPCLFAVTVCFGFVIIDCFTVARGNETTSVPQVVPTYKKTQVLVAAASQGEWPYLAFPAILDMGEDVLVSYKRGKSHAYDLGAGL